MADPMTQSSQISSSQGLADGQNSAAAKDSQFSDSFLSSSPVSLIQSPQAKELVYWRDPKKSGVVFGVSMLLLLSLATFSVISVASYVLLALLCVTISFRIYKSVIQAVQKSNEGHPFKALMEKDVSVPPETFRKHVDVCLTYINRGLKYMSRLFLVEDLVDSLKLAVVMWLLTYVGAVFNGITILILADILLFTVPLGYEKNKTQIDHYIDIARTQINTTVAKLQEKLPGSLKRKAE
ncbi:reticulon-3 isoform X3 [Denticeps clupeoides]|uniref:Reticulon n=1 Tax=Denticeps clupeoides TaxID=299321 RepID=A0AAY4A862_9TELE|nr:reticulon-3 isoform X3 [Denticeps clupeoides]